VCGIAGYTAALRDSLEAVGVRTDVRPIDRYEISCMTRSELGDYFADLVSDAADYDVVHIQHEHAFFAGPYGHQVSTAVFGGLLARLRGHATAVTFHSHPVVPSWRGLSVAQAVRRKAAHLPWQVKVAREFNRGTAIAVAPSRVLRRTLIESGLARDRVVCIPQGTPPFDCADVDRKQAKEELGFDATDRLIVQFGFVSSHKGHHVALEALAFLPRRFRLVFVGGPHPLANEAYYESVLEKLLGDPALFERVRITGHVPSAEVRSYFAAADVCIVPYLESKLATSAAAAWALTSGRPVIGTRIPALVELEQEAGCLRLVTPHAARELAAAICEIDGNEELAKLLVTNAEAYCERTAWPLIAHRHVRLYDDAVAQAGRVR
jgi:glycosyltransferase involved in cell wall biosynthesis